MKSVCRGQYADIIGLRGQSPAAPPPQGAGGFTVKATRKGLCSPSLTKKTDEARHMPWVFLQGGLERSLHGTVKVKSRLSWRPQDVGEARTVRYLPRRAANREWNQPQRGVLQSTRLRGLRDPKGSWKHRV